MRKPKQLDTNTAQPLTKREVEIRDGLAALIGQAVDVVWGVGSRQETRTTTGRVLAIQETITDQETGKPRIHDRYVILDGVKPPSAPVASVPMMQSRYSGKASHQQVRIPFSMIERYSQ